MATGQLQRTHSTYRWLLLLLVLAISLQNSNCENTTKISNESQVSSTTVVYSSTNHGSTAAPITTTMAPEEIIFITTTKKVKDAKAKQLNPVYYGVKSGNPQF